MKYAMIYGDDGVKSEPLIVVYDNGKYEFICKSFDRQKYWYAYIDAREPIPFEKFLRGFTYSNIDYGDVTDEVQSLINKLRAKYMVEHLAQAELEQQAKKPQQSDTERALLEISKRIRTGNNERGQ